MTRSFIQRVIPRLKTVVATRPPFARPWAPRKHAVPSTVAPHDDPLGLAAIRYGLLGVGGMAVVVYLFEYLVPTPSPPPKDAIIFAVTAKAALEAFKAKVAGGVRKVKAGTGQTTQIQAKSVKAESPQANKQRSELIQKAADLLLKRKGGGRRKKRRLRLRRK